MKIAYITHYYPPGGGAGAINTYEIVKRLARGNEITVFTVSTYGKYLRIEQDDEKLHYCENGFQVRRSPPLPLILSFTLGHSLNLTKLIKEDFDVVISQFHPFHFASFTGFLTKIMKRRPWAVKVHDMMTDPNLPRPIYEKAYAYFQYGLHVNFVNKYADKVLVLSSELRDFLSKNKSYRLNRIAVVPNGVDITLFHPPKNGEKSEEKVIIYTGSMFAEDGLDLLIKAFSLLKPKSELRLLLVGDGPERYKLQRMVLKLGLKDYVMFRKYVTHNLIPDIVGASYLGIGPLYPSLVNYFTIPTKILEYFACGVPVISCKVSSDILIDGVTGLSVRNPTSEKIAEKISCLLNDEKLTKKLGASARELVVKKFDWQIIIKSFERQLTEIILRS